MRVAAANPEALSGSDWIDIARLFPSFGLAQVLQAITGFLVAQILLPAEYGLWSLFAVVLFYTTQLHLGSINLMQKEVPFFLAAKDCEAAEQVTNFAFSFALTNCVAAAAVIFAAGALHRIPGVTFAQIALLALLVVSQELFVFVNYWLRAYRRFSTLRAYLNLQSCCNLALVAALASWKHLTGVLLAYIVTSGGVALGFMFHQKIRVSYRLIAHSDWKKLGKAVQLLLWTMMFVFLTTIDRVFIGWRLGILALGLFGISLLLSNVVYNTSDVVLQVLFPRASALAAGHGGEHEITRLLLNSARVLSYILAIVLGLVFLLLPSLVPVLLPRYSAGILAARIVCLGLGPLVLGHLLSVTLVVMERLSWCLLLQGAVLLVKAMLLDAMHHPGLSGVALVSCLTNVLYLLAMLAIIVPLSSWERIKSLASLSAPWLLIAAILLCVSITNTGSRDSGKNVLVAASLYLLLAPPSLWAVYRYTRRALYV